MASSEGYCIRFSETDVRPTGRTAMGVKSMRIPEGAYMVDLERFLAERGGEL